ncbi:MAG: RluA family pseudouridine synthase [Clostridiales bacterium]|nr:RluA family pseudouridine synthase [Clostridiales bacterium]MCD8367082.1 RluA family pseudouridine synthase [Clostridiales bacterium]
MDILYQDNRILVCIKPAGIRSTDEPGGLPDCLRRELGDAHACLRTVHRLDQVVGGVMVLARSREAARRLSAQVRQHALEKDYLAVVHGVPAEAQGEMRDLLARSRAERKTYVVDQPGRDVREAVLRYRVLETRGGLTLVGIRLQTGRTHQIRAQFSARGLPLVGDGKYGAPEAGEAGIGLWSCRLSFTHPQTGERVTFSAPPPRSEPWTAFPQLWAASNEREVKQ